MRIFPLLKSPEFCTAASEKTDACRYLVLSALYLPLHSLILPIYSHMLSLRL